MKPQISICIPVLNRSRVPSSAGLLYLLPKCIDSIRLAVLETGIACEIVIADYGSTDWPLQDWLWDRVRPVPAKLVTSDGLFSVGDGKNAAALNSSAPVIFFCDADMIVPPGLLVRGLQITGRGSGYFPLYQRFCGPDHKEAYWGTGHGCCVVLREHWERHPWIPTAGWGSGEDDQFCHFFWINGIEEREQLLDFYHQWHPLAHEKAALDAANPETAKELSE